MVIVNSDVTEFNKKRLYTVSQAPSVVLTKNTGNNNYASSSMPHCGGVK